MTTKKNSIITPGMKKAMEDRKAKAKKPVPDLTPEQEAFINRADVIVNPEKDQPELKKVKKGRPASGIKKRKVTFDLSIDLIDEIDTVANFFGMNRAQFVSQAVMKAVREAQRANNL